MKTFLEWLKLEQTQNPIVFAGQIGVIIPSAHGGQIGPLSPEQAEQAKPIIEKYGYYYEGVGEGKQAGVVEGNWIKTNLEIPDPNNGGSYDKKQNTYPGVNAAATFFSSLHVNLKNFQNIPLNKFDTGEDVLRFALKQGINLEHPLDDSDINKFIEIIESDNLDFKNSSPQDFITLAQQAEKKMWGTWPNHTTPLSEFAWNVEKYRRSIIFNMAKTTGGAYFLGSDHLPYMAQEHGN